LQKEIVEFWRSDFFKNKVFTVELVDDSLYEWQVELLQIDADSELHKDLQKLKKMGQKGTIVLNITFGINYPFHPPFVRVVEPLIAQGHVLEGGAMCMELLLKQGWSAVYTAESVILQVAATLVRGKGRVHFDKTTAVSYSLRI
jgi:ubiquitin-conjugating enzyme E2 Q